MIEAHDRIRVPDGVELRAGAIHDPVRAGSLPVNATGLVALAADTPAAAADALRDLSGVDPEVVLRDVLRFCSELNARLLLNVAPRGGGVILAWRWARRVPLLLPLGLLPRLPVGRSSVDTADLRALARTAAAPLARCAASIFATGAAVAAVLLTVLGVPSAPALAVSLGAAVASTVALHELAHLVALRGVPACLVTRGLRVAVVHRATSGPRTRLVAGAGPAAGLLASAALLAVVALVPSSEGAAAACVALLNAFGLTVLSRDGRTLCGLR